MMGYEPCALPSVIADTSIPAVEFCLKTLSAARNEALAAHELAQQVMSSCSRRGFKPFAKGDKVWLEARNLKHLIINPKFAPKWKGPFTITKVLSPIIYQLRLPKTWKEVLTTGTIHGVLVDGPLHQNHLRYSETCFECHHLGHIRVNCQWYVCPICKVNCLGHPQYCCLLNHHVSRPSSLSLSSSSSRPRPIPPSRSHWMVRESSRPPHHFNCPSPPRSPSPIEDFDYDDVTISNMTGSPVRSYEYF